VSVFIDTSGLLAYLDADDADHAATRTSWDELLDQGEAFVTTNYVVVEAMSLVQRRFGLPAVKTLQMDVVPILRVVWIDAASHSQAVTALLTANRRNLSLVDCASFETMRRLGISTAFAIDRHFREQGFRVLP
jgi:predicted nucleic acid-binding protein